MTYIHRIRARARARNGDYRTIRHIRHRPRTQRIVAPLGRDESPNGAYMLSSRVLSFFGVRPARSLSRRTIRSCAEIISRDRSPASSDGNLRRWPSGPASARRDRSRPPPTVVLALHRSCYRVLSQRIVAGVQDQRRRRTRTLGAISTARRSPFSSGLCRLADGGVRGG